MADSKIPDPSSLGNDEPGFADARLVGVLVEHHGAVTAAHLQDAGYDQDAIQCLVTDNVLTRTPDGRYAFPDPTLYIDLPVLIQWRLPDGIFGARTALVFYNLTDALPMQFDVCVPERLLVLDRTHAGADDAVIPYDMGVHPFSLPEPLRTYGVTEVYPAQPGDVPVAMYQPAVAVVQTLADPYYTAEIQKDCVSEYVQAYGVDAALREAAARYGVEHQLQELIAHMSPSLSASLG